MGMLPNEMNTAKNDLGLEEKLPRVRDYEEAAEYGCLKYLRRFDVL